VKSRSKTVGDQIAERRTALWHLGEDFAADMLIAQGWTILERNWKAGRYEVDIIALDPEAIVVFIEIKTRITSLEPGVSMHGLESITYTKRHKLVTAANIYLHNHQLVEKGGRLDVIVVNFLRKEDSKTLDIYNTPAHSILDHLQQPTATHIKQAFY
jgi:putative endonuclease